MTRRCFLTSALCAPLAHGGNRAVKHLIWRKPADASLVMRNGPDGIDRRPQPPLEFVEEDLGGTNPKIKLKDSNGSRWIAKWAEEVHAETFASRLAAVGGYFVRTAYFVQSGEIAGCRGLRRAKAFVDSDGRFRSAVMKLIAEDEPYLAGNNWGWTRNPFLEFPDAMTRLDGLKIMLMLVSNWDAKDMWDASAGPNTAIYEVKRPAATEYRYAFDDWGGSMGRWGNVFTRSKWDAAGYEAQSKDFILGLDNDGFIQWGYSGRNAEALTHAISRTDAASLLEHIGSLENADLEAGLLDAGAEEGDTAVFVRSLRSRISQLERVARV